MATRDIECEGQREHDTIIDVMTRHSHRVFESTLDDDCPGEGTWVGGPIVAPLPD